MHSFFSLCLSQFFHKLCAPSSVRMWVLLNFTQTIVGTIFAYFPSLFAILFNIYFLVFHFHVQEREFRLTLNHVITRNDQKPIKCRENSKSKTTSIRTTHLATIFKFELAENFPFFRTIIFNIPFEFSLSSAS